MLTAVYNGLSQGDADPNQYQMAWATLADLYHRMGDTRKEYSIPGSTTQNKDQLFGKEDLQQAQLTQKINQGSKKGWRSSPSGYETPGHSGTLHSFRSFRSFGRTFAFGKGKGKSHGGFSFGGKARSYGSKGRGKGTAEAMAATSALSQPQGIESWRFKG